MTSSFGNCRRFVQQTPTLTEVNKKDKVALHGDRDGLLDFISPYTLYLIVEASS